MVEPVKAASLGRVERRPDPGNQRAKLIAFTPHGGIMLERLGTWLLPACVRKRLDRTPDTPKPEQTVPPPVRSGPAGSKGWALGC